MGAAYESDDESDAAEQKPNSERDPFLQVSSDWNGLASVDIDHSTTTMPAWKKSKFLL